jgi:hypothetical protein
MELKFSIICLREECKKEFITFKWKFIKDSIKYSYCPSCRRTRKKCANVNCNKEHFRQGISCSNICALELKKNTNLKNNGAEHNFSKHSKSRKDWEHEMLLTEGISNVFQRKEVKDKIIKTCYEKYQVNNVAQADPVKNKIRKTLLLRYGVDHIWKCKDAINKCKIKRIETLLLRYGVDHIWKLTSVIESNKIKNRRTREKNGIWKSLDELTEAEIYYYHVWKFTHINIKKYGKQYFNKTPQDIIDDNKKIKEIKYKITIDHKYSIIQGFKNKIPAYLIGSILNLELLTMSENSKKATKCSITKEELYSSYYKTNFNDN